MGNCNQIQPVVITATLAAGDTASPYYVMVNISQRLCFKTCSENTPVFAPRFSMVSVANVGIGQYVATCHVEGIVSYIPCGGGCDCTKQQPISANFTIPFYSASVPASVTITAGSAVNGIAVSGCQNCSRQFVSETPISLAVS